MKFQGHISRMFTTTVEVEAEDEEQAEEKIRHILEYEDISGLEWEHIRKSDVIDEVVPLEGGDTPIIRLGRPNHLKIGERVTACGRVGSGLRLTTDLSKVDCIVCRKTKIYKEQLPVRRDNRDHNPEAS